MNSLTGKIAGIGIGLCLKNWNRSFLHLFHYSNVF